MGNDDGFDAFYSGTRQRVVTFLYAISGDMADAQDIAQEAYTRAWQRWPKLATYGDPEAWVRTVGYRLAANRWRKARNRLVAYRRHGQADQAEPPTDDAVALVAALRQLPDDLRYPIVLYHLLDLPVADVARHTSTPINTVKTRLARGRRALAEILGTPLTEEVTHA